MHRFRYCLIPPFLAFLVAGCRTTVVSEPPRSTVIVEEPRHVVVEDPLPPDPKVEVVIDGEEDDVSFVVYREYYDCSEDEIAFIPYYRIYYGLDDDDLFFLIFVARHTHQPIDVVIRTYYYDCFSDYDRLIVYYRVDRVIFFVDLSPSITLSGPYDRPYRFYRDRKVAEAHFTKTEYRALVSMKIGVEYQGAQPERFERSVRENPQAPHRAVVNSKESLGKGGRNVNGAKVAVSAPRPWKMSVQERQNFHQQRQERAQHSQKTFQERHPRRVEERQKDLKPGRPKDGDLDRKPPPKKPSDVKPPDRKPPEKQPPKPPPKKPKKPKEPPK